MNLDRGPGLYHDSISLKAQRTDNSIGRLSRVNAWGAEQRGEREREINSTEGERRQFNRAQEVRRGGTKKEKRYYCQATNPPSAANRENPCTVPLPLPPPI